MVTKTKHEAAANNPSATFEALKEEYEENRSRHRRLNSTAGGASWCSCPYTYTIIICLTTSLKYLPLLDDHSRTNKDRIIWLKPRGFLNFTPEMVFRTRTSSSIWTYSDMQLERFHIY
jgi:hypothetical protein